MPYKEPWFDVVVNEGVEPEMPGLYEWRIEGAGSYIGKYTHSRRPLKEYAKHVRSQFEGGHYRPDNKDGWRRIHRELYLACVEGRSVTLVFLENGPFETVNARERAHIEDRGNLNGARLPKTSITPPSITYARELKGKVGMIDDEMRAVAKRLAFYQKLVNGFESSLTLIDGHEDAHPMTSMFASDIIYLMRLEDDDDLSVFQMILTLMDEENSGVVDILERRAEKLGVD